MDHYIRGSYHDVNLNRALTHWLSCANLPYNVLDGGVFMNWCCTNNPWYRVACRPYIQRNSLDTGYAHNISIRMTFVVNVFMYVV